MSQHAKPKQVKTHSAIENLNALCMMMAYVEEECAEFDLQAAQTARLLRMRLGEDRLKILQFESMNKI